MSGVAITRGLLTLASSGELKSRQDVTDTLEGAGFEVVGTTKTSISIAAVSYTNIRAHET
ncbi:hypothetical protein ACVGW8_07075 [Enterobacter hormaechei]